MSMHARARQLLIDQLEGPAEREEQQLNGALRSLAQWRSRMIQNTILHHHGTVVTQGPFAGLDFLRQSAEGCHAPKLLGCYEQPLHPHIEWAIAEAYPTVLNIGCAEGYYAVGLARRMADTRVLAFDTNAVARDVCVSLAEKNGVSDRVTQGALFAPVDFDRFRDTRTLIVCDIEGGEKELLNPETAPALRGMDVIVESHDCYRPGMTQELARRFAPSHDIILVEDDGQRRLAAMPGWFKELNAMDKLLATWEWRIGPTPWLVMKARIGSVSP